MRPHWSGRSLAAIWRAAVDSAQGILENVRVSPPRHPSLDETTVEVRGDEQSIPRGEGEHLPARAPGSSVGRYLLIGRIGEGGMGVVWRAYDPKLQREVALKMVRTDRLTADAQARIIREARSMAQVSHPNVVAVYDVELEAHTVVLAMELVDGQDLQGWLGQPRSWSEIIEVFTGAGRGLAEAHAVGLLHRDFKPANVLLGSDGRPRVTDFGLARGATSMGSLERGRTQNHDGPFSGAELVDSVEGDLTAAGMVMGTPAYMAPEQHLAKELDERADQYAFCVSLRAALLGELPFRGTLGGVGIAKLKGPPPWPRASKVPRGIMAAIDRGMAPKAVDRWPTMGALLAALEHDEGRRRRAGVLIAAFVTGGAALALVGPSPSSSVAPCSGAREQLSTVWDPTRRVEIEHAVQSTQAAFADKVWAETAPALDAYAEGWVSMYTEACEATNVRRDQSAAVMDLRMSCLQRARGQLRALTNVLADADPGVLARAHELLEGLPGLERCADVEALQAEVAPPEDPAVAAAVERAREHLAEVVVLEQAGKPREARVRLDEIARETAAIDYAPLRVELMRSRGRTHQALGEYAEAELALREAVQSGLASGQWQVAWDAAVSLSYAVGQGQGRHRDAMAYLTVALGLSQRPGFSKGDEASSRIAMGTTLRLLGELDAAEAEVRRALALQQEDAGGDAPRVALTHNNLANTLYARGKYAEASAEHDIARQMYIETLGPRHPEVAMSLSNGAGVLVALGRNDEAAQALREALDIRLESLGPEHPETAASRNNLAVVLIREGAYDEAAPELRKVIEIYLRTIGPNHPRMGGARTNLANVLMHQGKLDEAESELAAAIESVTSSAGPKHLSVADAWDILGVIHLERGQPVEAAAAVEAALSIRLEVQGPTHPDVVTSRQTLGDAVWAQKKAQEAIEIFDTALRSAGAGETPVGIRVNLAWSLADVLWDSNRDRPRAVRLIEEARILVAEGGDEHVEDRERLDAWLREHGHDR